MIDPSFDQWLVCSDLDGSLLNHHDYSHEAALPMLRRLDEAGIPVVFNTSKTLVEMLDLANRLDNRHPFIVENGSAIVIPEGYFAVAELAEGSARRHKITGHDVFVMGETLDKLREFLDARRPAAVDFTRCGLDQAIELTGLADSEVRLARTREYSIPLVFTNPADEAAFSAQAREAGLRTLKGGRFLHLLGNCDKGEALMRLKSLYQRNRPGSIGVIALGDSPNDQDMLIQADRAIVVESPSSAHLKPNHPHCYRTRQAAPRGWVEGIETVLFASTPENIKEQEKFYG